MLALGVDHRSAPTAVREALAFEGERRQRGLDALKQGTISRRIFLRGQFFPQILRGQLEELPEAQVRHVQAQQAVRRLTLAATDPGSDGRPPSSEPAAWASIPRQVPRPLRQLPRAARKYQ
jgi:hypothetical protein